MQQLLVLALLCATVLALPQYPADSDGCVTCKWIVAYTAAYSESQTEDETKKSMDELCDELNHATAFQVCPTPFFLLQQNAYNVVVPLVLRYSL
jgi:hypothetical protein